MFPIRSLKCTNIYSCDVYSFWFHGLALQNWDIIPYMVLCFFCIRFYGCMNIVEPVAISYNLWPPIIHLKPHWIGYIFTAVWTIQDLQQELHTRCIRFPRDASSIIQISLTAGCFLDYLATSVVLRFLLYIIEMFWANFEQSHLYIKDIDRGLVQN